MTNRWQELKQILYEAVAQDPDERMAFLEEVCDDEEMRAEVQSLLEAYDESDQFFADELDGLGCLAGEASIERTDDHVGPYRLIRPLNEGGMSVLYLAERDDTAFEKKVVIKLLPRYFNTEEYVQRFRAERQILASLNHPGIASLLDGGVTEEGHPYLVMEHVEGDSILEYCRKNDCGIEERLELLNSVCAAVQYAHQNLIVHRDLKPSNIMVTEDGQVKLLDFGIAKLLDDKWASLTAPVTRTGQHWMTPEYAAPEQIEGESITTATDVYQLGVLAYELLAGRRPYDIGAKSFKEMEYLICETVPQNPSQAVVVNPSESDADAELHSKKWRDRLNGELDTIVMKALRKKPNHRYDSAGSFASDLRKHLNGLPIAAMPATPIYRTTKFIQRHKTGFMVTTMILLMLVGYAVTLTVHSNKISIERDRAQAEAERAEAVAGYLSEMFLAGDPYEMGGEDLTAKRFLERGVTYITHLNDQPVVQAEMLDVVGQVYRNLGYYDQSRELLEQAIQLRRSHRGVYHKETAQSYEHLGSLLGDLGNFEQAENVLREAMRIRQQVAPEEVVELADTKLRLAYSLRRQGKYADAEPLYRASLEIRRENLGADDPKTLSSMSALGTVLQNLGEYEEAEHYYRRALSERRHHLSSTHPDLAMSLNNLGTLLLNIGQFEEAEELFEESLEMRTQLFGEEHPLVALTKNNLGNAQREQGNLEVAQRLLYGALETRRMLLGQEHIGIAINLFSLGEYYLQAESPDEALSYFTQAHSMFRNILSDDHSFTVRSMMGMGSAYLQLGNVSRATRLIEGGYDQVKDIHSVGSLERALADMQIGQLKKTKQSFDAAEEHYGMAYQGLQEMEGQRQSVRQVRLANQFEELQHLSGREHDLQDFTIAAHN